MTRDEMIKALASGKTITQYRETCPDERRMVNKLVEEGKASASKFNDGMRHVVGTANLQELYTILKGMKQ